MSWFSKKIKKTFRRATSSVKSAVSKATSSVKSAVSNAGSKIGSFVSTAFKAQTKLATDPSTITDIVGGFASGGLAGAVSNAVGSVAGTFAEEYDTSGNYNPEYEYKKYGFPSKNEYELAKSYGYTNYDDWLTVKDLLGSNVKVSSVTPVSGVSGSTVDKAGNIVVGTTSNNIEENKAGAGLGGLALGALGLKVLGVI